MYYVDLAITDISMHDFAQHQLVTYVIIIM